ncbi:hypothetical protein D3C87_1901450 [compost metagenome]
MLSPVLQSLDTLFNQYAYARCLVGVSDGVRYGLGGDTVEDARFAFDDCYLGAQMAGGGGDFQANESASEDGNPGFLPGKQGLE